MLSMQMVLKNCCEFGLHCQWERISARPLVCVHSCQPCKEGRSLVPAIVRVYVMYSAKL